MVREEGRIEGDGAPRELKASQNQLNIHDILRGTIGNELSHTKLKTIATSPRRLAEQSERGGDVRKGETSAPVTVEWASLW